MRAINLSNEKKRNAQVGFEVRKSKTTIFQQTLSGKEKENVRFLKATIDTEAEDLLRRFETPENVAEAIVNGDPDIEFEKVGMRLDRVRKVYIGEGDKIVYSIVRNELVFNPDGTEKEKRPLKETVSNVNIDEIPLKWTGKLIPKSKAIRMFAFTRKYQIKHVNGLTFDFLFEMAKQLQDSNSLMLVGGGAKGNEPIVLSNGGTAYRGFLEGRYEGETYCLILHLTNLELKGL